MARKRSGLRGDLSSLGKLKGRLRQMPLTIAHDVARRASPELTKLTRDAFDQGQTVYGEPRPRGVGGDALALSRTGAARESLRFATAGRVVRCLITLPYVRYLIGKYGVLPNGPLPAKWSQRLGEIVRETRVGL